MKLITKLSGLLKATEETASAVDELGEANYPSVRVICRVSIKTVMMCENSVVQSLIRSNMQGQSVNLFPQTLNLSWIWDVRFAGCGLQ
jgi:hypothetical protein